MYYVVWGDYVTPRQVSMHQVILALLVTSRKKTRAKIAHGD